MMMGINIKKLIDNGYLKIDLAYQFFVYERLFMFRFHVFFRFGKIDMDSIYSVFIPFLNRI